MKTCNRCRKEKLIDEFFNNSKEPDGKQKTCKKCQLEWQKKKRERIASGEWRPQRKLKHPKGKKICTNCLKTKLATIEFFVPMAMGQGGLSPACRVCVNAGRKKRRATISWSKRLVEYVNGPRHTSRTDEPFDLTTEFLEDLFDYQEGRCAWTAVKMTTEINSDRLRLVTLDRINNARGYTKDNVVLVCKAANQARGSSTPDEFASFIADVRG